MLAQVELQRGCIVPQHAHVHEQVTYAALGLPSTERGRGRGDVLRPSRRERDLFRRSNLPHAAEALEDTQALDVFSPPREDWLNRSDDYLRR